jgi:hypothetical protein
MRKPGTRPWVLAGLPLLVITPVAVGGSSASAAGAPIFANWAQSRFDPANSGFNPNESTIDSTNAARLEQAWVRTDDESSNAAPAVVDNIINWTAGQTVPSLAVVQLSAGGKLDLYNAAGSADVVVDVAGWFQ